MNLLAVLWTLFLWVPSWNANAQQDGTSLNDLRRILSDKNLSREQQTESATAWLQSHRFSWSHTYELLTDLCRAPAGDLKPIQALSQAIRNIGTSSEVDWIRSLSAQKKTAFQEVRALSWVVPTPLSPTGLDAVRKAAEHTEQWRSQAYLFSIVALQLTRSQIETYLAGNSASDKKMALWALSRNHLDWALESQRLIASVSRDKDPYVALAASRLLKELDRARPPAIPGRTQASFFGTAVSGRRSVFAIDASSSMGLIRPETCPQGISPYKKATAELLDACGKLTEDARVRILKFDTQVRPWPLSKDQAVCVNTSNRVALEHWLGEPGRGGTDIYKAVIAILDTDDVDQGFILTDGQTAVGELKETGDILAEVNVLQLLKPVPMNTVNSTPGTLNPLLVELARSTGGAYSEAK